MLRNKLTLERHTGRRPGRTHDGVVIALRSNIPSIRDQQGGASRWLSDNGSAYIAKDTLDTATALGLKLCFTPVRSPESNGIAEAFVKTFKRDYARLSISPMPRP